MKLSSNTGNQQQRILKYLQENRAMTTVQAREDLDIFHPGARIQELREQGHDIITNRRPVATDKGSHKAVAEYVLMETNFAIGG